MTKSISQLKFVSKYWQCSMATNLLGCLFFKLQYEPNFIKEKARDTLEFAKSSIKVFRNC
jgi:hypothetical protein